jgi:3-hydroxyisobutyrate dehydrogenase-like beta-hydroxyacid dehydrogenase
MNPIISIMAQGAMGAATAARLVEKGLEVRTDLTGRSAASAERAAKAGMKIVSEDVLAGPDFLLSIVPPSHAISLAKRLSPALGRAARKPTYVDFNTVNPQTTKKVAQIVQATGARFVDGSMIGGPPRAGLVIATPHHASTGREGFRATSRQRPDRSDHRRASWANC